MKRWNVIGWDGPSLNTWEVEADHVTPGTAWLSFTVGEDPRSLGLNDTPPVEVARFVTENVFMFNLIESDGVPMPQQVKRVD